jgi:primosomal protein N' (replication factor Y)
VIRSERRAVCVLNRTGRARLLACGSCGTVVACEACGAALRQAAPGGPALECPGCGLSRPAVCAECHSTRMRALRVGVSRAREELEALAGRRVAEVTATTEGLPAADLLVGTEAVLRRVSPADGFAAVAFVDFDQELLAPRMRAWDEALGLLAAASRVVRGRSGRVVVQTRSAGHPVLRAATLADPGVVSDAQVPVRRSLRMPPFAAVAVVSGPGSREVAESLRSRPGPPLEVLGPDGDRWLVKAADHESLADALASVPRPAERVRVAVDPARL